MPVSGRQRRCDRSLAAQFGMLPALVRQKSKVLGQNGRDSEAADLIVSIEDTVGGASKLERGLALRDGGTFAARSKRFDVAARLYGKAVKAIDDNGGHEALAAGLRVDLAMALWDGGERAQALGSLADAFDIVATLDAAASRENERVHQFARGVGGLLFHDTDPYPLTPRPNIAYGGASALSLSSEALLNADLKPLADNWRIMAFVEADCDVDVGIDARSRAVQSGPGMAAIESMIGLARFSHVLLQDDLDAALASGIRATSSTRVASALIAPSGQLARVDIDSLIATPVAELLADDQWRDAVVRLAVDLLVARRLQGNWTPDLLDKIRAAWMRVLGDETQIEAILKAATGTYAVGGAVPFNVGVALAASRREEQIADDPALRFHRDMMLVGHISQSMARRALEPLFVPILQQGWTRVLASQRFRLRAPSQNSPAIEQAVAELPVDGLRAAARLIIAAAPSVGETVTGSWVTVLGVLASKRAA